MRGRQPCWSGLVLDLEGEAMGVEVVLVDRDGKAHRLHKVSGEPVERVRTLCKEGTQPLDAFDLKLAHHCGQDMRCPGCFLTPVDPCSFCASWGVGGQPCVECGATIPVRSHYIVPLGMVPTTTTGAGTSVYPWSSTNTTGVYHYWAR